MMDLKTEEKVKAQIAVIPESKCQLCDEDEIHWKCLNCEEYLCDKCKKLHKKSKASRDHKITSVAGSNTQPCEKEDTERQVPKCNQHTGESVQFYCKECEDPVCRSCVISGSHKEHTLLKIEEALKSKEAELSTIAEQRLSDLENNLISIQKNKTDYTKDISTNRVQVKLKGTQLKAELETITHDILHQLESREKEDMTELKTKEETVKEELLCVKDIIKTFQSKQSQNHVYEISFILEAKQKLNALTITGTLEPVQPPNHYAKHMNLDNLKGVIGKIQRKDQEDSPPKSETTAQRNIVRDVAPDEKTNLSFSFQGKRMAVALSDGRAWLADYWANIVSLMSKEGYLIRSVDIDEVVFDIAVSNDGCLLFTVNGGNKVTKFDNDSLTVIYEDYSGFTARGITVTDDGSIVVCLCNEKINKGKLICLADTGISTIQYDADDKSVLFQNPLRVCSNRNGDLIVLQKNKMIIVIDSCRRKRFRYDGSFKGQDKKVKDLKDDYDPWDVVTDKYGHILISDNNNSCVHVLDKDGKFLKLIDSQALGLLYPLGMCIDASDRLWVCSYVIGIINVITYLTQDGDIK
ncbi:hypothetical protein KUTeg_015485 [Tegillarca granosa]|uniref:B box-type domain-containing protein n=1 Tax=Tegillarca granosa TaxID=220873 RepID=A0ABQ9EQ79_TEGGR|nr:hypothetical protein KUTeg_015485 [Tegillarca granosa]